MIRSLTAALIAALLTASPSFADEPPPPPSTFGATPTPAAPAEVAPDDFKGMLANCDIYRKNAERELAACKQDAVGVDFLGAAYLALWAILMAFFILVRLRQRRLDEELKALRARLAKLTDDAS